VLAAILSIYLSVIIVFLFFLGVLLLTILLKRLFIQQAMSIPVKLFNDALQKENDGRFEEAESGYRFALEEVNSKRFQNSRFKDAIIEKLKVLNTVIENGKASNNIC